MKGTPSFTTITCNASANTCAIPVPAPAFALVFLSDTSYDDVTPAAEQTFATTAYTKTQNTATVDPSVLSTSNGHSGKDREALGSTSKGSSSGTLGLRACGGAAGVALLAGAWVLGFGVYWA